MKKRIVSALALLALMFTFIAPSFAAEIGGDVSYTEKYYDADKWEGENTSFVKRRVNSRDAIMISNKDGAPVSAVYETDTKNPSKYTEINVSLVFKCDGDNVLKITGLKKAEIWEEPEISFTYSADIRESGNCELHIPIQINDLDKIRFEMSKPVSNFVITDLSFDNTYAYIYRDCFNSYSVDVECDNSKIENNRIVLGTDHGYLAFSPRFLDAHGESALYLVTISADSTADGKIGILTDSNTKASADQSLLKGEGKYYFLIFGAFDNAFFTFTSDEKSFTVSFAEASLSKIGGTYDNLYGKVSSCVYSDSAIVISGSLAGEALTKFIGADLLVFSANLGEKPEISRDMALVKSDYSTRFEIAVPEFEGCKTKLYYVYIDTFLGLLPVGSPIVIGNEYEVFNSGKTDSSMRLPYNANLTSFIYSNADSVLLSLNVSDVILSDDSYSEYVHVFNSVSYNLNYEFCDALANNLSVLGAYGKTAYFEITPDTDSFEEFLCVVDYLKDKATGIVIRDLSEYSDNAETLSAMYSVAVGVVKSSNPDVYCAIEPDSENYIRDALALRYYMSVFGIKASGLVLRDDAVSSIPKRLNATLVSAGLETAPLCAITDASAVYNDCLSASDALGFVFCAADTDSVASLGENWPRIKEGSVSDVVPAFSKKLVDYTNSYDTSGWIVCGGFRLPTTELGENKIRYAFLRSTAEPSLAVYTFDTPVLIGDGSLGISFTAEGAESTLALSVTVGSETDTVRYTVNAENGKPSTVILDLNGLSDKTLKYVSIEKSGTEQVNLRVNDISLYSDNEETIEKFEKKDDSKRDFTLYAAAIVAVVTVIVFFSVLFRKKRS